MSNYTSSSYSTNLTNSSISSEYDELSNSIADTKRNTSRSSKIKKTSFSPNKYRKNTSSTRKSLINFKTITKGSKKKKIQEIDLDLLNILISDLRYHSDDHIEKLNKATKQNFEELVKLVETLYDTNSYNLLTEIVTNHFSDVKNIVPGTIGAYCIGCNVETSFKEDNKSCSSICAGSMPIKGDTDNLCKETVILANYKNGGFTFTQLRSIDNESSNEDSSNNESIDINKPGIIFIPHTSLDDFPGFTMSEKRKIQRYGINHINLYGYGDNGKNHYKLDSKHIYEIKSRKNSKNSRRRNNKVNNSSSNENLTVAGIIFLVFLLIGAFLLSNYIRNKKL